MRAAGPVLIGAAWCMGVALCAAAATRPAVDTWVGSWGYVSLPPPPGVPIPPSSLAPVTSPSPLGPATAPAPVRPAAPPPIDNPGNVPVDLTTTDLSNVTVRQVVRVSQGGTRLRLRFSNEHSADAQPLVSVHIAEAGVDGAVVPGTDHVVTFDGHTSVIVPGGAPLLSDPIDLPTRALEKLYISTYLPNAVPTRAPRTLFQYVAGKSGDFTAEATLPSPRLMRIPPYVTLVEVQTATPTNVVVALGDSITQGTASTANAFRGWPDRLAERLVNQHWAVVNAGIGGNRLLRYGLGPSVLARLDRDVLSVPGVQAVIVMEGINDIGTGLGSSPTETISVEALEAVDKQIVARAHERGIRVIGATLTPYQGAFYATAAGESAREAFNHWILSSGTFDATIDFAPAVADPANALSFDKRFNDTDHLHPNDAGYKAMADAVSVALFPKP